MAVSMTGFGRATLLQDGRELTVELRSVNHRYLDLTFRMPRHIGFIEDQLRRGLQDSLSRGHVDVFVNYRNTRTDARKVEVDKALLGEYLSAARDAAREYGLHDDIALSSALRLPDVTNVVEAEEDREAVCALAVKTLELAVDELKTMRSKEGARLSEDILKKLAGMSELVNKIEVRAPFVAAEYGKKLAERIESALSEVDIDRARLATEVALFTDRASVDEEIVRLKSHMEQLGELISSGEPTGRRMDFVVQEMNRELNTIGSKANDSQLASLVIMGKSETEKIREQVQNFE